MSDPDHEARRKALMPRNRLPNTRCGLCDYNEGAPAPAGLGDIERCERCARLPLPPCDCGPGDDCWIDLTALPLADQKGLLALGDIGVDHV